jgi:hypothetical protein
MLRLVEIAGAFAVVLLLTATQAQSQGCAYVQTRSVQAGRDERGYFVRVAPPPGWQVVDGYTNTAYVAHFLASEAGAVVYDLRGGTVKNLGRGGEWRGQDPLSTLRAFATAGGLEVVVPQDGFWLIGPPATIASCALSIFAYPIDPGQIGRLSEKDSAALEHQILLTLPVLSGAGAWPDGLVRDEIGYYWVPEERDTLIVTMYGGRRGTQPRGPFRVFKVRAHRSADGFTLECQWGNWGGPDGPQGQLLFGINEDFDGDGYRDFVFLSDDENVFPNTIVSGRDGRNLAVFSGPTLAVDKTAHGPRRFAAGTSVGTGHMNILRESAGPAVFEYSPDKASFAASERQLRRGAAVTLEVRANDSSDARNLLARDLGGPQHVRVYLAHFLDSGLANLYKKQGFDVVHLPEGNWPSDIMTAQLESGFPAHLQLTYQSSGYVKAERDRGKVPRRY